MIEDEYFDKLVAFIQAQQEAEQSGEREFECPVCGEKVTWSRVSSNNHLRCGCSSCGIRMME